MLGSAPPANPSLLAANYPREFAGEPFFMAYGNLVARDLLSAKRAERIARYRAARLALRTELREQLSRGHDASAEARAHALAGLAAHQAPRLLELEAEAEQIRHDLTHVGFLTTPASDIGDLRPLNEPSDHSATLASLRLILSAAHSRDGFSPDQRRLLEEMALETILIIEPEPGAANPPAVFFWPAGARIPVPAGLPPEAAARFEEFQRRKATLKDELRTTLARAEKHLFNLDGTEAYAQLASAQAPRFAELDALADQIRPALAADFPADNAKEHRSREGDYAAAVLASGLSPAQRRLLLTAARADFLQEHLPSAPFDTLTSAKPGSGIEVIVVAERAEAGDTAALPSPEHPVHYLAYDAGYLETGRPMGGVKSPDATRVGHALREALGAAGYEPATAEDPPALVIVYSYGWQQRAPGTFSTIQQRATEYSSAQEPTVQSFGVAQVNDHGLPQRGTIAPSSWGYTYRKQNSELQARLRLVATEDLAGRVLDHLTNSRPPNAISELRETFEYATDPRFFLIVSAYDYADLTRKTVTPRWSVRLSALETSGGIAEVIPALAGMSAPWLGRNLASRQITSLARPAGGGPVATTAPFSLPRAAAEKLNAAFLRSFLRTERALNIGQPEWKAGYAPRPPVIVEPSSLPSAQTVHRPSPSSGRMGRIDVTVVAEQTDAGVRLQRPTPERPAYYVACDGGYIEAGNLIAGEKPPDAGVIRHALQASLVAQGYQPATTQTQPSLLLLYYWGVLRKDGNAIRNLGRLNPNYHARLSLVAPVPVVQTIASYGNFYDLPLGGSWPINLRRSLERAEEENYFVIVSAYDYADFIRQVITPLWRLKLSTRAMESAMAEALPALLARGGTYFGCGFDTAQYVDAPVLPAARPGTRDEPTAPFALPANIAGQIDAGLLRGLIQQECARFSGEFAGDPDNIPRPVGDKPSHTALTLALAQRIAAYQKEKAELQDALVARLKAAEPGRETRQTIDAFETENAARLAALNRTKESIRSELARLATANAPPGKPPDQSLDSLLRQFAADTQQLRETPPAGR